MKIRELKLRAGSAIASAWPPQWGGSGGGPWPIGAQGTIVDVAWAEDRRSLRIINRFQAHDCEGPLVVDDPDVVLPRVLWALSERVPISVEDAGDLDVPRELRVGRYTIEAGSYRGQPPGAGWGWLAKALISWDQGGETHHVAVMDTQMRLFAMQDEADVLSFRLGLAWVRERG